MALRHMLAPELAASTFERIIIYGRAGIGKTRLALSLPPRYGDIIYYAADTNTEFLSSISPEKRNRVIVVKPEAGTPIENFMEFCIRDWSTLYPNARTIVVDTFSKIALDCITQSANSGSMDREKHYVIGDPTKGGQAIPNRGDYQAIESLSRGFLNMLFEKQKKYHIVFVCHEDVKVVEGVQATGGPAHPGRAMLEYLPAQFNTVIRLIRDEVLTPDNTVESVVVAVTENDGRFIAKVRTADEVNPNPIGRVVLDRDPVNLWNKYDFIYAPKL
jgi:hypothetical protein